MSLFNPMAIFRRTETPMTRRRRQDTTATSAAIQNSVRNTRGILRELEQMTFTDEASNLTAQQVSQMYEAMTRGTSIRRRRGHEGGYDLVHKA